MAGQHVVKTSRGWGIKKARSARVFETFNTQAEAIAVGVRLAREKRANLYVHDRDGRIRKRFCYETVSVH